MASGILHISGRASLAGAIILLGSAAWAQSPEKQSPSLDQMRTRQPTTSPVQQEDLQISSDQARAEADRKMHEIDRRLDRTLRSVCSGC